MTGKKNKHEVTDVVADLQERTRQAQELAAIPRQELLADPRLNPATRAQADALEAARLRERLDLDHRRVMRSEREADRRATEAVRAAEAVDRARAATDPAYTVLALVRNRGRFAAVALGASLLLSVGSAMGLEAAVTTHYPDAPTGIGYVGEIALTGMSTAAIIWAGLLARGNTFPVGPWRTALIALIVGPLIVSIVGSVIGSGPVGAVASIGSAAFAWFSYLVSVTSSEAITQLVTRMRTTTATEVPTPAEGQGDDVLPRRADRARDALEVVGEEIAERAADYLRDHGGDDTSSPGGDDGSTGDIHPSTDTPPALEDAARRRSQTARQRVEDYYQSHPDAPVKTAARELGVDPKTVRKYRPGGAARG